MNTRLEQIASSVAQVRIRPLASRYPPAVATALYHSPVCVECFESGRITLAVAWGKVLKRDPDPVTWQGYCQRHQEARIDDGLSRLRENHDGSSG